MGERAPDPIVLVVDDEASIRDLFARMLECGGYLPIGAETAEEALALLNAGLQPDAIILDLKMPGMGGFGLLIQLRSDARYAGVPIGIVTGDTFIPHASMQAAAALGAEVHFKPITMAEVLALADRLITRRPATGLH